MTLSGEENMPNSLTLKLFDPGMTHLHRVGLAGLYLTLKQLDPAEYEKFGGWNLTSRSVALFWKNNPRELLGPIIEKAFGISRDGVIEFLIHRKHRVGNLEKVQLHNAILRTFLQHGRTRNVSKKTAKLSFEYDNKNVQIELKPIKKYQNQSVDILFNNKDEFKRDVKLAGWAFPGGGVRHIGFSAPTTLTNTADKFLCLLFAPVGSLFFLISCKNQDGKFDSRKGAAIVLPHIKNLETYCRCYRNYLQSPVERLYANSLGDAGLSALVALNLHEGMLQELEINSCSVVTLGTIPWSKQQKTRTALEQIKEVNKEKLAFFHFTSQTLQHKMVIKEDETYYVQISTARGLIAENIAADRPWFADFYKVMLSQKLARATTYDKKGLHAMVQSQITDWPETEDKLFVEAIHNALKNRYGALAARASAKGERIPFDREFERIRTSLMRSKNSQTLRAEIADLFARGGVNKSLQQNWPQLLSLFTGPDWQKARDLALLSLASYSGKGADELRTQKEDE